MTNINAEELKSRPRDHYLGYHTIDTMSYAFDRAETFTLVTSNENEALEVSFHSDPSRNGFIWVIEGRKEKGKRIYYLREIFKPSSKASAARAENYEGAKKKFQYKLSGEGKEFSPGIILNDEEWFSEFKRRNGNFGFGLRKLTDADIVSSLIEIFLKHQ